MLGNIDWNPNRRKVRGFSISLLLAGLIFGVLLVLLGRERPAAYLVTISGSLGVLSYFLFPVGKIVYRLWMGLGWLLGRLFSPVVTAVIFYLLFTPVALIRRLAGKDTLARKRPPQVDSYFSDHPDISDSEHFRRQF